MKSNETQNETAIAIEQSPQSMITIALQNNADPAVLSRLMDLQERYDATQARKSYVVAMSAFKAACPAVIGKDKRVRVQLRTGGEMSYQNASIGALVTAITPALSANGLSVSWSTEQAPNAVTVTCHVTHQGGHRESVTLSGPRDESGGKNAIQTIGSSVTYLQRYTLQCALGLATADQDDADDRRNERPPVKQPTVTQQAAPDPTAQPGELVTVGPIEDVQVKSGGTAEKPWTKYGIKIGGMTLGTFDAAIGEDAQAAIGVKARAWYEVKGKYMTVTRFELLENPDAEPVETTGGDDYSKVM